MRAFRLGIILFAATHSWAADTIQPLDIKPGLWEIVLSLTTSGLPPIPPEVSAKLTDQQRAQIDAQARERAAAGPRTTIKRSCFQEKNLRQPLTLTFGGGRPDCKQTVASSSGARQDIRVACGKGASHTGGRVLIEVLDPGDVRVSWEWSATGGSRTMKMSATARLKWIGAACEGQAEPAPAPKPPPAAALANAGYYYKLGKQQIDRNDLRAALSALDRAIELDPHSAASYNARGYVYLRLRSFANAIPDFSEAIRLRSDYANAFRNRAVARRHLDDAKGAEADEQKAAELERR